MPETPNADFVPCPACDGYGIQGGRGSYYDVSGRGKPCGTCKGRKVVPAPNDGSEAADSVPHICSEWYGPGLSFCGICGKCGRCGGTGYALIFRLTGKPAGLPNCRRCRSTGWDPERSLTET